MWKAAFQTEGTAVSKEDMEVGVDWGMVSEGNKIENAYREVIHLGWDKDFGFLIH